MELSAANVLLALAIVAASIYYYLARRFSYWTERGVAGPKPSMFWGHMKELSFRRSNISVYIEQLINSIPNEKLVGIFRFWHPVILVRDLDLIQHIFIRDFDNFVDRGFNFGDTGIGKNLFTTDGDTWRVLRTRMSPIFTTGKLKNMFHLIDNRGDELIKYLTPLVQESADLDVYDFVQKYTMGTISACAFGFDIDFTKPDPALLKIDKIIFTNNFVSDFDIAFPGVLKFLNTTAFPAAISNFFHDLVQRILKDRSGVPSNRKDFMDLLLELRNAGEVHGVKKHENDKDRVLKVDDEVMAAQAFVFYAAGYETSATTLGYMLHELARNPEIQERVVKEINQVLEDHNGELSYECLKQMKYLEQVFDETLRLYPIVDPLMRRSIGKYTFPGTGVTIEPGTLAMVSVRTVHRDPEIWPKPLKFDPDRFLPENVKLRHPCAYMPFGLGPRNCIGMRFAQVQSRVCAVKLLTKFRMERSSATRDTFEYDPYHPFLGSKKGVPLRIVPRT